MGGFGGTIAIAMFGKDINVKGNQIEKERVWEGVNFCCNAEKERCSPRP